MNFVTDKQTIGDLGIFGKNSKDDSVFKFYNHTQTYGGRDMLEVMFSYPLCEATQINNRLSMIQFLSAHGLSFQLESEALDLIEYYLRIPEIPCRVSKLNAVVRSWRSKLQVDNEYYIMQRGILYLIELIHHLREINIPVYKEEIVEMLQSKMFCKVLKYKKVKKLSAVDIAVFDHLFRYVCRDKVQRVLEIVYSIDALNSVANTAKNHHLAYPTVLDENENRIDIEELYHPLIKSPVTNTIRINASDNVCFITGANMAGKSTFMKAFGVAVYLAHLGFPVPASKMEFSPQDGLLSTINLGDNLQLGYSHFYAEVVRIKEVAQVVATNRRIVVLFDELFRGTNVKDAYNASMAIITAFAKSKTGLFVISTHILEVAEELQRQNRAIRFYYFQTNIVQDAFSYPYQLKEGITNDRLGMMIIARERILEILGENNTKE